MSGCIYCIDNDILKKLATFDLFDETINLFDASPDYINVLATAKHKFRRDWKKFQAGKIRNPEDNIVNYVKIIGLAQNLSQIVETDIDIDLFSQLSKFEDIDSGEAVLTAHVAQLLQKTEPSEVVILTGDKNYLRALAQIEISLIQDNFTHRFWCLEQLIHRAIGTYGFGTIRDKILPVRECDKAIKVVFGSGQLATENNSMETLNWYIEDLRKETGNLLAPYPH